MISNDDVPYADPEPFAKLIQECRCLEGECAAHGVTLHPGHQVAGPHPAPVTIGEATRHMVDGWPDYGS